MPSNPGNYTNDAPFLLTQEETHSDRDRHLHFLLPDGQRRIILVNSAEDSEALRNQLGDALANGRTGKRN